MDDLISRQAAIDALNDLMLSTNVRKLDFEQIGYNHALADGILTIRRVPSAQPRKKGKWKRITDEVFADRFECSECGKLPPIENFEWWLSDFCPNCGAEMVKGEEDETD